MAKYFAVDQWMFATLRLPCWLSAIYFKNPICFSMADVDNLLPTSNLISKKGLLKFIFNWLKACRIKLLLFWNTASIGARLTLPNLLV